MLIAILDALTLGLEADFSVLEKYGELKIHSTTCKTETFDRIEFADVVISNKVYLGKEEIAYAKKLKLICVAATGYNNIDTSAAKDKGIVVCNVKSYSTESVAQHTFALILALQNSLFENISEVRNGNWSKSPIFTMINHPFNEISGKKIGILGYGTIGKRVAEISKAFGMKVLIGKRPGVIYNDINRIEFSELISESDIISIHTPLSDNTRNLFGLKVFKKMKKTAILINVARGGIVNENDLFNALSNQMIKAAAIDVCDHEPIEAGSKLPGLKNLLITPHIAWASVESRKRLIEGIANNIEIFLSGNSDNINLTKN